MDGCRQRVAVNGSISKWRLVASGVLQMSVSGLVLFMQLMKYKEGMPSKETWKSLRTGLHALNEVQKFQVQDATLESQQFQIFLTDWENNS